MTDRITWTSGDRRRTAGGSLMAFGAGIAGIEFGMISLEYAAIGIAVFAVIASTAWVVYDDL